MEEESSMEALRWSVLGGMSRFSLVSENKKGTWISVVAKLCPGGEEVLPHTAKFDSVNEPGRSSDFVDGTLTKEASVKLVNEVIRPVMVDSAHILKHPGPGNLDNIPDDLAEKIMLLLKREDVVSLGQTCKPLRAVSELESVWRNLYTRAFNTPVTVPEQGSWRTQYQLSLAREKAEEQQRLAMPSHGRRWNIYPPPHPPFGYAHAIPPNPNFVGDLDRLPQVGAGIGARPLPFGQRQGLNPNFARHGRRFIA